MRDRYQGGSLAGFLIIGVLLTLVLVGGLYGLNRYNAQKASEEVAANDESSTTDKKASETDSKQSDEAEKQADAAAAEKKAADEKAAKDKAAADQKAEAARAAQAQKSAQAQPAAQLPQTGPVETFSQLIAITALTFAFATYLRSRTA